MKRLICFMAMSIFALSAPLYAAVHDAYAAGPEKVEFWDSQEVGAQFDAPNLIKFSNDWSIGSEVTKNFNQNNTKEGYTFLAKITCNWSLIDLTKK